MANRNSNWLLIILVALVVGIGAYMVWGNSHSHQEHLGDIEYLPQPDSDGIPASYIPDNALKALNSSQSDDNIEIIEASDQPAFEVGFGMGPGLYGSGRHTSEMVGN